MSVLEDKVALVTGGSRGIGAAIVKLFWREGAQVVFNYYRDREAAEELVSACHPDQVAGLRADVSKMADAESLVKETVTRFGKLDILVANAGVWNPKEIPIDKMSEREWDRTLDINLKGVYAITRYAVAQMKKQGSGRVIAISSTAGQRGEAFHANYAASKGGIISFVKGLSTELAPHGILVNCVAPGWVDTDMARPALEKPEEAAKVYAAIPLRRIGTPDEIAGPVLFLAGPWSTFITGEILNVNGGAVLVG